MIYRILWLSILFVCSLMAKTQAKYLYSENKTQRAGNYFETYHFDASNNEQEHLNVKLIPQKNFNGFSIGWNTTAPIDPQEVHIKFRYKTANNKWSKWSETHGHLRPEDSPSNVYWAHPQHTDYFKDSDELELILTNSKSLNINYLQLGICNIDLSKKRTKKTSSVRQALCPSQPYLIPRDDWWGTLDSNELYYPNTHNSKQVAYNINTTHAFVHHGASSNTYTDGADVARFYWTIHVVNNGWKDIAYNYLVDRFGNLYQGRYNPDFPNQDAWGAHTGVCNPYSFAICMMGNLDTIYPTDSSVSALAEMLAYKMNLRNLDPLGVNHIVSNTIDIISGHRDAPGSSTACPGDSLHSYLPMIRQMVKDILDSCQNNADLTPPNSLIDSFNSWQSDSMSITYSDNDSSGNSLYDAFYLISDLDSIGRTANNMNGFFYDEFKTLRQQWITQSGVWYISSDGMTADDDNETNTNIYTDLLIDSSYNYLFHWKSQITGSGGNQRGGIHFTCDSPQLYNRGDSYFLLIREDDDEIQLLKSVNNVYSMVKSQPYAIGKYVWYDQKVIWNVDSGIFHVFINDQFLFSWQDSVPIKKGEYISLRAGNTEMDFNFLKVYKSRGDSTAISIGPQSFNDIRYQNPSPNIPSGKIWTMSFDSSLNISQIDSALINIDWTPPDTVLFINDGDSLNFDIDTMSIFNQYSSYWGLSNDNNSGIMSYEYSMGSNPGHTNLKNWSSILDTFTLDSGQNVSNAQNIYYNVRAINNAGLTGSMMSSDGQMVFWPAATANFDIDTNEVCYGDSIALINTSKYYDSLIWVMGNATALSHNDSIQWVKFDSSDNYPIYLMSFGPGGNNATTITENIIVHPLPNASFSINDSLLSLGDPYAIFINNSTGGNSYLWSFGDGGGSTDTQPWHEYASQGNFDVSLIVNSELCGSDTINKIAYIKVNSGMQESELRSYFHIIDNIIYFVNNDSRWEVSLWNSIGQSIAFYSSKHNNAIDLSKAIKTKDLYFLKIYSKEINKVFTTRILSQ